MSSLILQPFITGVMLSVSYILVALGLVLIFGIVNIFQFSHGTLYMVGGFITYVAFGQLGLNYFLSFVIAVILVGLLGVIIELGLLRHSKSPDVDIVITLGIILILQQGAQLIFGVNPHKVPSIVEGSILILGGSISYERTLAIGLGGVVLLALFAYMRRTRDGQAMIASAQNATGAALVGINISRMRVRAMFIGSGLAGAAGAIIAPIFFVDPYMWLTPLNKALSVLAVGGLGSVPGAVGAGFIIGMIDSYGSRLVNIPTATITNFLIVMIILIVRPTGLAGRRTYIET